MGPGDRLILNGENLLRRVILPEKRGKAGSILAAGRLGDADDLLLRLNDQFVIVLRQGLDGEAHLLVRPLPDEDGNRA